MEFMDWLQATGSNVIDKATDAAYVKPFEVKQAELATQQGAQGQTYIPGRTGVAAPASGIKLSPLVIGAGALVALGFVLMLNRRG